MFMFNNVIKIFLYVQNQITFNLEPSSLGINPGFDFETNYTASTEVLSGVAVSAFLWENVAT